VLQQWDFLGDTKETGFLASHNILLLLLIIPIKRSRVPSRALLASANQPILRQISPETKYNRGGFFPDSPIMIWPDDRVPFDHDKLVSLPDSSQRSPLACVGPGVSEVNSESLFCRPEMISHDRSMVYAEYCPERP
jgi:hypothetical protein